MKLFVGGCLALALPLFVAAAASAQQSRETRMLVTLSVEHWSAGADGEEWTTVHQDITQKEALSKKARPVRVDARRRKDVDWSLKDRKGPPPLTTGRHRLVVVYLDEKGERLGQVLHEFVIADCSY